MTVFLVSLLRSNKLGLNENVAGVQRAGNWRLCPPPLAGEVDRAALAARDGRGTDLPVGEDADSCGVAQGAVLVFDVERQRVGEFAVWQGPGDGGGFAV